MGYKVGFKDVNDILATLSQEYDIYGPKRFEKQGRYSDTDIIRYDKISKIEEVVFDQLLNLYSILQKMNIVKVK